MIFLLFIKKYMQKYLNNSYYSDYSKIPIEKVIRSENNSKTNIMKNSMLPKYFGI